MRYAPIFRDAYEVTDDDLVGFVAEVKKSDDDVVSDALIRGARYTGMAVTGVNSLKVNVANGRLWAADGRRFYSDEAGGVPLDLSGPSVKPALQSRIVAIVAYGEEIPTDIEERDYETDATTQTKEPRQVTVNTYRHVRLDAVPGAEAVAPVAPVVATALVIATVLMTPAGIDTIAQNAETQLDNLADVAGRTGALEDWRENTEPKVASILSDLAAIRAQLAAQRDPGLMYALAADVAELKLAAKLPSAYVNYRADDFSDASNSNMAAPGYRAKTEEGLRFPAANVSTRALSLANPYDTGVTVSGAGLLLPKYSEYIRRIVPGGGDKLSLAQYAYENRTATVLSISQFRMRYGDEFELSTGSAQYLSGQYLGNGGAGTSTAAVFQLNGQTFQQYDTGKVDPDGHKIVRLARFWADSLSNPYWSRVASDTNLLGYAWVETFVASGDQWWTALGPRIQQKPADGMLYVGICRCVNGEPDLGQMLCLVGQPATFWTAQGGLGSNKCPIPPTFLEGGQRYGFVMMTAAGYVTGAAQTGSVPTTGTLFYYLNGGIPQNDPGRHLMFDAWVANFPQTQVAVELSGLNLDNGMAAIDIIDGRVVPDSCSLVYQILTGDGVWRTLAEGGASLLADLPPFRRLRALMTGTNDVMPGLNLGTSQATASRPATAVKHVSAVETLGAPSSTIVTKSSLKNFDPAHHGHTVKIFRGAGYATLETADSVVDVMRGDVTERTCTFNLAASVTSYVREIDETADSATNLFVCSSIVDIAE